MRVILILIALLSLAHSQTSTIIPITQKNIKNNWTALSKQLNSLKELQLCHLGLSQLSLLKIFNLPFPNLKKLNFTNTDNSHSKIEEIKYTNDISLTPMLVEAIFISDYFPHLDELDLTMVNLDDRSFQFLDGPHKIVSSLVTFKLNQNLISKKGFKRLATIDFGGKLKELQVISCLLQQNQAVDALLDIICNNNSQLCENKLQILDLSSTHINRNNFIKVMTKVNKNTLKELKMNILPLYFKQTLKQGFDYSAYQYLASQKFPLLQNVQLMQTRINNRIGNILSNWRVPNLKKITLLSNPIGDQGILNWITNKNMPKLQYLQLYETELTDLGMDHLIKQNFSNLKYVNVGATKLSNKGVLRYSQFLTGSFQTIAFTNLYLQQSTAKQLFQKLNLTSLKYLNMQSNTELGDLMSYFPWKKLGNLQMLQLSSCKLSKTILQLYLKQDVLLPKLKKLILDNTALDELATNGMIASIQYLFPNLEDINFFDQDNFMPAKLNILKQVLPKMKEGLSINLGWILFQKRQNKLFVINLMTLSGIYAGSDSKSIQALMEQIHFLFDFSQIQLVQFFNKIDLMTFIQLCTQDKITQFPQLSTLSMSFLIQAEIFLDIFNDFSMPSLSRVILPISFAADRDTQTLTQNVIIFFSKYSHIKNFNALFNYLDEGQSLQHRKYLLDSLNFPMLKALQIFDGVMQLQQIQGFLQHHNQTLRQISLSGNFFQNGFFDIIINLNMYLTVIDISSTSFTVKQFAKFGKIKTGFIQILMLGQTDLTNDHIFAMIEAKQDEIFFPNLQLIDLQSNDIRSQGLQAFLQTGLVYLRLMVIQFNSNPNFINQLLNFPNRLTVIIATNVDIYSLDPDLEPSAANQVIELELTTKSFYEQDFTNLAKLSFQRLQSSSLQIVQVYNCSVFQNLLKINKQANQVLIQFENDLFGLNSSCLANVTFESNINSLIIVDKFGTTYLPEFINALANSKQNLQMLVLKNTRLSAASLATIFSKNLQYVQNIILTNNYLDDATFAMALQNQFPNLQILDISSTDITIKTLAALTKHKFPELKILSLSSNTLGFKAIQYLTKLQAPELSILFLSNCGLDSSSLRQLISASFPNLLLLDISYNDFQEQDISDFIINIDQRSLPKLTTLFLDGVNLQQSREKQLREIISNKGIKKVTFSPSYNLKQSNSAKY